MPINVFTASGNIGADCELKYTQNGKAVGKFKLPVKTGWGDKQQTSWVTCKLFGDRAESLQQYLTKGSLVTVTGAFQYEQWEHEGKRYSQPCILVSDVQLSPRPKSGDQSQQQQSLTEDFIDDSIPF
jgi:single-strand DNA-binding protein